MLDKETEKQQKESYFTLDNILDENVRIKELKDILKSSSEISERSQAASQLGEFGKKATTVLIEALDEEKNEEVIAVIIRSLGNIGDNTVVAHFIEKLKESAVIRAAVVGALGMIGDKSFLQYLSKTLKDKERKVRIESIHAIDRICSPEVLSELIEVLKNDKDSEVRAEAIKTLVNIVLHHNNQKIVEDLGEILILIRDSDTTVPFLKNVIKKELKELEIIGHYDNVVSDRDHIYRDKKALEKQLDTIDGEIEGILKEKESNISKLTKKVAALEKGKAEKYKEVKTLYTIGMTILIAEIVVGGIFLLKMAKKSDVKVKQYSQKVNDLEEKMRLQVTEEQQAKQDVAKYQEMKDMEDEMNKLGVEVITANNRNIDLFMKCHDAFFNTDIKKFGLDLAYEKKKGFSKSAKLAMTGKVQDSRDLYKRTDEL